MIAKDTTTIVRFYATTTDGFPATGQASNISASISLDGDTATAIIATISESDSTNLPGWYEFEYTFNTVGNAFITFTCANCRIMPWEEDIVEVSGASASDIAYAVWSDKRTYPLFQGTPMGYYQANPPIINVWSQQAFPQQTTTYGDLVKAIPAVNTNVLAVKSKTDNLPASPAATGDAMALTSAAITAVQAGLSTFNAASDTVTINATQAATMVTATGFATPSDLTGLSTFDPANDTVTINATQAATMVTADVSGLATPSDIPTDDISAIKTKVNSLHNTDLTGIATSTNITTAQQAIITHGDSNWTGGGSGGATAQQIWEYPTRTITDSPTDISSLATKTDLSNTQTAIVNAMPSVSGLATSQNVTDAKNAVIAAIPAIPTDYAKTTDIPDISGLATSTNVSSAQAAIIAAIPTIPTDYAKTTDIPDISGLSTFNPATDSVQLNATQLASLATGSDVTDAKDDIVSAIEAIDIDTSDLAKATDVAVVADMIKQVDAGVLHWSTTATVLTLYKEDNTVLRQYSLQRDIQGNITRIDPING